MRWKYVSLLSLVLIYSLFKNIEPDIINCALTSLSIIFGFNMTYMGAVYTNEKFNKVLKINNQLIPFLNSNKKFLYSIIYVLIGVFLCSVIGNKTYYIEIRRTVSESFSINIRLQLQLYILAVLGTLHIFMQTKKGIDDFMIIYKNSYSNYLEKKLEKVNVK